MRKGAANRSAPGNWQPDPWQEKQKKILYKSNLLSRVDRVLKFTVKGILASIMCVVVRSISEFGDSQLRCPLVSYGLTDCCMRKCGISSKPSYLHVMKW